MPRFTDFGNDLYSGRKSFPFVPKRKLWLSIAAVLVVISALIPVVRGGFNLGIDFTGGSEFVVSDVADTSVEPGQEAVAGTGHEGESTVTNIAPGTVRVQTEQLDDDQTLAVRDALVEAYDVSEDQVASNFVGPTWGAGISQQMVRGLVIFLALTAIVMALYFRTWKMSVASMAGVFVTVALTVGTYSLIGWEVTPSALIGFLTVLSYSLYDTVVVFDKVRENTRGLLDGSAPPARLNRGFLDQINLAANQTLVRSLNTSVVGLLPVGSILFIGAALLGAGTLKDLALAQFVGIVWGTLATLFVATPVYAALRSIEPAVKKQEQRAAGDTTSSAGPDSAGLAEGGAAASSEPAGRA
ncbi:protein translocase subunit SecF [Kocuria coralli]|uniref:Protein translocase subunit SecF n=1 Tax=Kocuria coralli TaxID=1461025 RepID=A0A5J5L0G3_9MICC|nr:protein translocase subunit SecF [Kocuria coralli]KAA9395110.1 protein translocase subunit SecF [Kocuria coralli]